MEKLGLADQAWYKMEEAGLSPVYGAGIFILDPSDSPYPLDGEAIRQHIAARFSAIPLMRKKIVQDPLKMGSLRLVDDPDFNAREKISLATLPEPGGYDELMAFLGEYTGGLIDVTVAPWRCVVVEGLESHRVGVVVQIHHSLVDGPTAMRVFASLWDEKPMKPEFSTDSYEAEGEAATTDLTLLKEAVKENIERYYVNAPRYFAKYTLPIISSGTRAILEWARNRKGDKVSNSGRPAPKPKKLSFNVCPLSPRRSIAYFELPIAEAKSVIKTFGGTLNDLVLLINSYAMESYLNGTGEGLDFDLIAGMPINVRAEGDDSAGNASSVGFMNLHNSIPAIEERLAAIMADTAEVKERVKPKTKGDSRSTTKDFGKQELMDVIDPRLLDIAFFGIVKTQLLKRIQLINLVITNVPGVGGSEQYMAGAKQEAIIPLAPPVESVGLTVSVSSTSEKLLITYCGCGDAIQEKELFVEGALSAYEKLKNAAGRRNAQKPKAKVKRRAKTKLKSKRKS